MNKYNAGYKSIPDCIKHTILWGVAFIVLLCYAVGLFLLDYKDYTINSKYTCFSADMLVDYDPYVYHKNYLAVAESNGFVIDLPQISHSIFYEIVLEGEYIINYYNGAQLLSESSTTADNDMIISNNADRRKKVVSVPVEVAEAGYDKIVLSPSSGLVFSLSYFCELNNMDENIVLLETAAHQVISAHAENNEGSQRDVQGLFAFLADWNEDAIHLQLESATSELNIRLLDVENEQGMVLAEFPENSVLSKANLEVFDQNHITLETYSLPLIAYTYEPYNVYVHYQYEDDDAIMVQKVNPFIQIDEDVYYGTDIRTQDNMSMFSNLVQEGDIVYFAGKDIVLFQPLFIPEGLEFVLKAGQTIDLRNNAFILTRSAVFAEGTTDTPVLITSSDDSPYSGIAVLQAEKRSVCSYLICDNLGELSSGIYHLTGAVTFYESDADLYNCDFLNNRSEDALNTIRSDITVQNCTFVNTYQDAFDSDFCTAVFVGCYFETTGNDGIDVSTSEVVITDTTFLNINDKAISAGEASKVTVENIYAQDVQIGIGVKDSSIVEVRNITVQNALIAFCSYQKKSEYGPCVITVDGYLLDGKIDFKYLIEDADTLTVNGERWIASQNKKQALIIEKMINEEPLQ